MATTQKPAESLEHQLELLRSASVAESAQRVLGRIRQRVRWQRRQVFAAVCGSGVSAIGTVHFFLLGNGFAYLTLALCTVLLACAAWRSSRNAASLGAAKSGLSLLEGWRMELRHDIRQTLVAQIVAGLFLALTVWVVWRHGIISWKSAIYVLMATSVCVYATYQYLVIRPALKSELAELDQNA